MAKITHPNVYQIFVALDQLINTCVGGYADETLSSRAHRRALRGKPFVSQLIDLLFFWQNNHCLQAYESEINRTQYPPAFRDEQKQQK